MAQVTVCLFFLAIFQIGILNSSADETVTEGVSKNNEDTKVKTEDKNEGTTQTKQKVGNASDVSLSKDDKPNEEKEEDDIEKFTGSGTRKLLPVMFTAVKDNAGNQTGLLNVPKAILGPVNAVGAKINEAVAKGFDKAKDFAGGTYNFLRNTFSAPFGNN